MSTRKRRPLINVRWYRVRRETQPSLILRRLQEAIGEDSAVLFYTEKWMEAYRRQEKKLPLLRQFRPIPAEVISDDDRALLRFIHLARESGTAFLFLPSGETRPLKTRKLKQDDTTNE